MFRSITTVIVALFVMTAQAAEPDIKAIKAALTAMFPQMSFENLQVRPSQTPGLLEADIDTTVFYVTQDGKHILVGELYDIHSKRNLTDERRQTLNAGVLKSLPEKNMIVFAPKKTKATMTVFTDVDCGYCRKLHNEELAALNKQGVKVRYVLYPRTPPGTESYNKSISVWCSSDRRKAVGDAKNGKAVPQKSCDNPIADNQAVAHRLGVNVTPVIFLDDGKKLEGYAPAAELMARMGVK